MEFLPLDGIKITNLAINLPGPVAAHRLQTMGASVVKIEPPGGDPLSEIVPDWYAENCASQQIICLDLKERGDWSRLDEILSQSDLLLTATRPAALRRLNLGWDELHPRYPKLCQVAIVGYPSPQENRPGHDLTYQASLGLISPPHLPQTLLADLVGAERAVGAALAALWGRERGQGGCYVQVSMAGAIEPFAYPARYGLTSPQGVLGGGLPGYNIYKAGQGWVAVAALEPRFWERLTSELGVQDTEGIREQLQLAFLAHTAEEWEAWASERDLPVVAVRDNEYRIAY